MTFFGRGRRAVEERAAAEGARDDRASRLERQAAETARFLLHAAAALDGGAPPARVASVLASWAALVDPATLDARRPTAVAGPLAELIEEYRRLAGDDREILYIEDGGGDWLHASIHRAFFSLALRELLENVFRHASGWGRITVTAEPVPGFVVVKVRDDGAAGPCRPGLGLSLAQGIVELHGGDLRLHPEPGQGLTVTTRWPAAEPDALAGAPRPGDAVKGDTA